MHVRGVSTCTQSFIPRQLKNDDAAGSILAARQKGNLALALDMAAIVFYVVAVIVVIAASVTSSSVTVSAVLASSGCYCSQCMYDVFGISNICYYIYGIGPAYYFSNSAYYYCF